nr:hypothetical protein BaRGS_019040 [Batillaria attramentaria]
MKKFLAVTVALAVLLAPSTGEVLETTTGGYGDQDGLTFDTVVGLVDVVVEEVETLYQDIGSVNTLCAVNQDRVSLIEDKYTGLFSLKNRQQDALADLFQAQQASDTSAALHNLQQQLNTETSTNHAQDSQINHLTGELDHCKQQILEDLESNIDELCEQVNTTEEKVRTVLDFVLSRKWPHSTLPVINIPALTRPGNYGTCGAGRVIIHIIRRVILREAPPKSHP